MLEPVNFNGSLLIHDLDGHRIFLDTNDIHMTVHMLENHIWEPQVRQVIAASLHQGGCYVDVGANVGLHAVYAAGLAGSEGRVYAIEPNKHVYYLLKQNMDINGFFDRARLYNLAVSDGPGIGKMYIYQGHAGGSGLSKEELYMADCEEQTVSMDTLDHILEEEPKNIDVLKIDVEGFEVNVINGSLAVLQKNPDITIIMEWQPGGMIRHVGGGKKAPLRIIEVMRSFGYKAYVLKYMQPVKEIDINDTDSLLEECCDLVFTKGSHIDKIIEDEKNNEHCQQEASVSVQMEDMGDGELRKQLAFSEEAFKEAVKVQEDLKKQLEFSEKAFQDAVKVQEDLKKQLAFSKQAFQDAVKVQNELKSRIYHPRTADVMRALKYFVSKKR